MQVFVSYGITEHLLFRSLSASSSMALMLMFSSNLLPHLLSLLISFFPFYTFHMTISPAQWKQSNQTGSPPPLCCRTRALSAQITLLEMLWLGNAPTTWVTQHYVIFVIKGSSCDIEHSVLHPSCWCYVLFPCTLQHLFFCNMFQN